MGETQRNHVVRVWIGYALAGLLATNGRQYFYQQLGDIFIPATVELMAPLGLRAYIPSVLAPARHAVAPDEIALVFYRSEAEYQRACHESCAGRTYGALHGALFSFIAHRGRPASHSAFPLPFNGMPAQSGAIELFDRATDWQRGEILSEAVVRTVLPVADFRRRVCTLMTALQRQPAASLQGVYFYLGDDLLVCWSCWRDRGSALLPPSLGDIVLDSRARGVALPASVFAADPGVSVSEGDSLNLQFQPFSSHNHSNREND